MYLIAGNHHLWIESRSRPGEMHSCHLDDENGKWLCSCMGSTVHGHCWHLEFCEALSKVLWPDTKQEVVLVPPCGS